MAALIITGMVRQCLVSHCKLHTILCVNFIQSYSARRGGRGRGGGGVVPAPNLRNTYQMWRLLLKCIGEQVSGKILGQDISLLP